MAGTDGTASRSRSRSARSRGSDPPAVDETIGSRASNENRVPITPFDVVPIDVALINQQNRQVNVAEASALA